MNTIKRFVSGSNLRYLFAFVLLSALYLFFSFSYSDQPLSMRITNLIFGFVMTAFIYSFFLFIFIGVSQITAALWRGLVPSASQDPDLPEAFLLANLLFIFLLGIYIDQYVKVNSNPDRELSLVGIFYYALPFFTSFFGGIASGSLVLFSRYKEYEVIKTAKIVSIALVLIFFAYHFLTIRL